MVAAQWIAIDCLATVDLAVGKKYDEFRVNPSAKQVLQELALILALFLVISEEVV